MEINIRRAALEDREAICEIHASSIRGLGSSHYSDDEVDAWAGRKTPSDYDGLISDRHVVVAECDHSTMGFGTLDITKGEILQLYIHPDHARKGIGSLILDELLSVARVSGLEEVHLNSSLHAKRFYVRAGFQPGPMCKHRFRSGGEIDCISMTRRLHDPGSRSNR